MNLADAINKLKCYGIKGIADALRRYPHERKLRKVLNKKSNGIFLEKGITIVAPFSSSGSSAKVTRDLCLRIKKCGFPFQALDTCASPSIPKSEYAGLLTPPEEFYINRYSKVIQLYRRYVDSTDFLDSYTCFFWEFDSGLEHLYPDMNGDKILAMSDFNYKTFCGSVPQNVAEIAKILYPLCPLPESIPDRYSIRRKYGIPESSFVAFFNFDFKSSYYRKNPEGVIRAFHMALGTRTDCRLVFKTMRADKASSESNKMMSLIGELGLKDRVVCIDRFIPSEDLLGLTNACDVYMSLHRGEGFGITVAEAMQLGKPVIVTDYSATTEFCNISNSIPIPYRLVEPKQEEIDIPEYRFVKKWAEPDIEAAALALKQLYDDRNYAARLGAEARKSISEQFSDANFKKSIEAFLAL